MKAMVLKETGSPLILEELPVPEPDQGQCLIKVEACGVCRTDLHIVDGELTDANLPLVPGHEIVGTVVKVGKGTKAVAVGDRVGVPWLGWTCKSCRYCQKGMENLCENAKFTGYHLNGGYAEYCVAYADYIFKIPAQYDSKTAAPLLCAGLIGYRSYKKALDAKRLGLYGFGASAHIICQIAAAEGRQVFAFTRDGDESKQSFAKSLGAKWAGGSSSPPPEPLDAAIIFAPVGALVPKALKSLDKGGKLICAGIYMSNIPSFPYEILWHERTIESVANLTRQDGVEFMKVASAVPIKLHVKIYDLKDANAALDDMRKGKLKGAAVLVP